MKFFLNNIYSVLFIFLCFFCIPFCINAATLSLSPSTNTVSPGNILNVSVLVNTQGKVINNSDAIIQFPTDLLQVVSVDTSSSIFSLWVENPAFSNSLGQITFNGGAPNPGYSGSTGKIISITFLAKKAGTASLIFGDSSIRENDGLGTDVLTGTNPTTITIGSTVQAPVTTPVQTPVSSNQVVAAPVVTSSSHPQQKSWYNNSTVQVAWTLPSDATSVKTFLGSHSDSDTSVVYKPIITSKTIDKLEDGVWYFHVNYQTPRGWSKVAHYKLQIDTVNPKNFSLLVTKGDQGGAKVSVSAQDELSGVDHYTISVDNAEPIVIPSDTETADPLYIPILTTGDHLIIAKAYDKAGNVAETSSHVVTDVASTVSIDSYPTSIAVNDSINVSGVAPYQNAPLTVSLKFGNDQVQTYSISSDSSSTYHFISPPITEKGSYTLWVDLKKADGSVSLSSKKVSIEVTKPVLLQIGSFTTGLLTVLIPLVAMIFTLLFLVYIGWYKFFMLRKRRHAEFKRIEDSVHHSLQVLSSELFKQFDLVEKVSKSRSSSAEEKQAMKDLKEAISDIDVYIDMQIKKIEKNETKD